MTILRLGLGFNAVFNLHELVDSQSPSRATVRPRLDTSVTSPGRVGPTEPVAAIRDRETAVLAHRGPEPVPLALGGILQIRNHLPCGVVSRVWVKQ